MWVNRKRRRFHHDGVPAGQLGYRQQAAQQQAMTAASSSDVLVQSVLARYLLHEIMWGHMPPYKGQLIANLAWQDGARGSELERLKCMGSGGDLLVRTIGSLACSTPNTFKHTKSIYIYIYINKKYCVYIYIYIDTYIVRLSVHIYSTYIHITTCIMRITLLSTSLVFWWSGTKDRKVYGVGMCGGT